MNHKRPAFTLIEMLVAMALTLFIMVIISQAFVTALEVFSGLKGIGDLQSNLRTASTLMQSDLAQDHFEGKRKLSDPNLLDLTNRPREGFFYLQIGPNRLNNLPNTTEGFDADGMPSYRGPLPGLVSDSMYFTVKLRGNRRENFMSHRLPKAPPPLDFTLSPLVNQATPPNFFNQPADALFQDDPTGLAYHSQWAEVFWYLQPEGSTVEPGVPGSTLGTPLWALYRAQYLLVPNNDGINANNNNGNAAVRETTRSTYLLNPPYVYGGVSCFPNPTHPQPPNGPNNHLYFNSPADVVTPAKRAFQARLPHNLPILNSTRVLSNVISFQVRLMPTGPAATADFTGDYWSMPPANPKPAPPNPPNTPYPFKTWDSNDPATTTGIRAIQIIIRAWDPNSQQSRQITIVQDM